MNLYSLAVLVPTIAAGVRRMHDTDHSGWWIIVPLVNLVFAVQEGQQGNNRFGPDPKGTSSTADDEVLTNDAVLAMAGAHLGDDVIVSKIRYAQCAFRVSSSELGDLKKQGVSDAVISAMLESQANRRATPVTRSSGLPTVVVALLVVVGAVMVIGIIAAIAVP